jgi:hypothetical protein
VEQQSVLIRRAELQLADVEAERRKLAARAAEMAVGEDDLRQRTTALDRREAEIAGEASRWGLVAGGRIWTTSAPAGRAPNVYESVCNGCASVPACVMYQFTEPSNGPPLRLASDSAQLQPRLAQAERLARLEVELAAREAECRVKVGPGIAPAPGGFSITACGSQIAGHEADCSQRLASLPPQLAQGRAEMRPWA